MWCRNRYYSMNIRYILKILLAFLSIFPILGCGPEEHNPYPRCLNFGISNVRRNISLRVSVSVSRQPLEGVGSSTVKLIKLPDDNFVSGTVLYGGERIIFVPDSPLQDSTEYRFEILDGITDASGKPMETLSQEFITGSVLQVYYVDLLRNYDSTLGEVYSIAIYFSEGVNPDNLTFGEGNITIYDDMGVAQFFDLTYYDEVALAVLNFDYPLQMDKRYTLRVGPYIYSSADGEMLDGDRDGETIDADVFQIEFTYQNSLSEGITVTDSVNFAQPYIEPKSRCFLYEFD